MANKIAIITDTGADNLEDLLKEGIDFVPLYITFDGKKYLKQNIDITVGEFYEQMSNSSVLPKTSSPSLMDYVECFNNHLKEGEDIIYIALNSKFSSSYEVAISAKQMSLEEYPNARIEIIDTYSCTHNEASVARKAKELANKGTDMNTIINTLKKMSDTIRVYLTVDSLDNLKASGRLSNVSAAIGGLLNIKPIIKFENGILESIDKVRGINKALNNIITLTSKYFSDKNENINDYAIGIVYGGREKEFEKAKEFRSLVASKLSIGENEIEFCNLGVCIGVHAGPTLLGISFVKYENI